MVDESYCWDVGKRLKGKKLKKQTQNQATKQLLPEKETQNNKTHHFHWIRYLSTCLSSSMGTALPTSIELCIKDIGKEKEILTASFKSFSFNKVQTGFILIFLKAFMMLIMFV